MSFSCKVKFYVSYFWMAVGMMWNYLYAGWNLLSWTTEKNISAGSERNTPEEVRRKRQCDTVDFPYTNNTDIKEALERVIRCIYSLCISSWLHAPEEIQNQPLYKPISNAILDTCNNIQTKTKHIDNYKIILMITKGLTDHVNNFKSHAATISKMNREEEVNFLRQKTKSLLLYFLSDTLKNSDYIMPLLTEALAIPVLEMTINNLAEPTVINQLIVNYLGSQTDGTQGHPEMSTENVSHSDLQTDCQKPNRKKKKWTKYKKAIMFRSLCSDREDDLDSVTDHESSSDFEILCESYCQKWTEENWLASISKLTDGMFRISVSQRDELESELWEAERSMEDCVRLYHKLCQKYPDLEEFISKTPKDTPASADTQLSETITDPDTFIDHIVNLIKNDQNPEAAFFLSPFSYEEDKDLFDNILLEREASDESSLDDLCRSSDDTSSSCASDGVEYRSLNVESSQKDRKRTQSASEQNESTSNERLELDSGESDEFQEESKDIDPMTKGYDVTGSSLHPDDTNPHRHEQLETQMNKKKMEKAVLEALYNLADKIILGGKPVFRFAHLIGQMSTYNEKILQNIDHLFSEEHIVCYLNKISDLLESTEVPPPVQPESLKRQALELIEKQIQDWQINKFLKKIKKMITPSIMGSLRKSHEAFQDLIANKETLFKLLGDLSGMIIGEEQASG